jgi:hypothetical protein
LEQERRLVKCLKEEVTDSGRLIQTPILKRVPGTLDDRGWTQDAARQDAARRINRFILIDFIDRFSPTPNRSEIVTDRAFIKSYPVCGSSPATPPEH